MLFYLPRTTLIDNVRLNAIFVVLVLGALVFCIWDVIANLKYTTRIGSVASVLVYGFVNVSNAWARDKDFGEICKKGRLGNNNAICPEVCLTLIWTGDVSCYFIEEFASKPRYDEMHLIIGAKLETSGPAVERIYGIPIHKVNSLYYYYNSKVVLEYTAELATPVPGFWAGLNDVVPRVTTSRMARTIILDRSGNIFKRFEPDEVIKMTIAEVLWTARPIGGEDALFDSLKRTTMFENMTRSQILGSPDALPVWTYFTGVDIGGQLSCYNHNNDLPPVMQNSQDVAVLI